MLHKHKTRSIYSYLHKCTSSVSVKMQARQSLISWCFPEVGRGKTPWAAIVLKSADLNPKLVLSSPMLMNFISAKCDTCFSNKAKQITDKVTVVYLTVQITELYTFILHPVHTQKSKLAIHRPWPLSSSIVRRLKNGLNWKRSWSGFNEVLHVGK